MNQLRNTSSIYMDHGEALMVMEELVRGREFANQLGQVLITAAMKNNNNNILFAQHLVNNVLNSFTNTIFLLKKQYQMMQLKRDFSFISPTKSEEDTSTVGAGAAGRGSYKRRKTTETWEKVSETPVDDGHQWRKYGQKTILNSKYSRDYYRCTHKLDQRCEATKQVQRVEEKPPSYKTTYYNRHTCKNTSHNEFIFIEPTSSSSSSSILLSFNNTFPTPNKQDCPFLSSHDHSLFDCKEELVVIPSPNSFDVYPLSPHPTLHNSISSSSSSSSSSSTPSSSTKLESDDEDNDHKDIMMMMYGLLYDSVELDHQDQFFHPSLGLL